MQRTIAQNKKEAPSAQTRSLSIVLEGTPRRLLNLSTRRFPGSCSPARGRFDQAVQSENRPTSGPFARRPLPPARPPEDVPVSAPVPKGPLATARSPKGSLAWGVVLEGHPLQNPSTRRLPDPAQLSPRRPEPEYSYVATDPLSGLQRKQPARTQNALS